MEYLEGWELVPGHHDYDDAGREKLSSTKHGGADSQSESEEALSPRLDSEIPTEKNKEENLTPTIIIPVAMEEEEEEAEVKDPVSPISLKETETETETEFVDMKLLKSKSKAFDDEEEDQEEEDQVVTKDDSENEESNGGFDLWKWSWGLCSFGVATVCILVLGASTGPGVQGGKNNMGMGFKGYEENQRLKEMVSAVRGGGGSVPLARAHITFGGYYDAPSLNH